MNIDFKKNNGLVPVIIQDHISMQVLMLGYMNEDAFAKTMEENIVHFYSRSRQELWKKGETSGNYLYVKSLDIDCDNDTLLILAEPAGPVCHTGSKSCFGEATHKGFLYTLENTIAHKIETREAGSYTNDLVEKGINKVAQKVGEEAVEVVIEAKDDNLDLFQNEVADLLYHLLILLKAKKTNLAAVEQILLNRSRR